MRFGKTVARGLLAGALLLVPLAAWSAPAAAIGVASTAAATTSSTLAPWHGGIDLYRSGTFTTQHTWLWCAAADIQIARNIVLGQKDHSYAGQQRYFDWMRAHNRYRLPLSAGVDAQGWTAGFQHFVDARYRLVASSSFDAALRSAVTNLRRANLPVGITVDHGNHAWLLTGFTATADPAATSNFTVTSVRVIGPLYGLQSKNGYDMPPDTRLTPAQLRRFFTPWYYAPTRMVWDGALISIQPVRVQTTAAATPSPVPTAEPTPGPTSSPSPTAPPGPTASPSVEAASGTGQSAQPAAQPTSSPEEAGVAPTLSATQNSIDAPSSAPGSSAASGLAMVAFIVLLVAAGGIGGVGLLIARRR
jgi:hypothetical protein